MDRATGFYPVGWGFESLRERHLIEDTMNVTLVPLDVKELETIVRGLTHLEEHLREHSLPHAEVEALREDMQVELRNLQNRK